MITEKQVEESKEFLFGSADEAAQARADRHALTEGLKRIRALEMQKVGGAVSAQERDALASAPYGVAIDGLRAAVYADEKMRALREAHSARIEAWRTYQATMRSVRLHRPTARADI